MFSKRFHVFKMDRRTLAQRHGLRQAFPWKGPHCLTTQLAVLGGHRLGNGGTGRSALILAAPGVPCLAYLPGLRTRVAVSLTLLYP
jgi:hypothetical protein